MSKPIISVENSKASSYGLLVDNISNLLETARKSALKKVDNILVQTYWTIGKHIFEFEQQGTQRAKYGNDLINQLSRDLKLRYGKGFSRSNMQYMRLFYISYPNCQTLSGNLSWPKKLL